MRTDKEGVCVFPDVSADSSVAIDAFDFAGVAQRGGTEVVDADI